MANLPKEIAKEEGFTNFEVIEKTDNTKLMNEAEIIIINYTTMGLESLILDKPIICYSFKDLEPVNPYRNSPAIKEVFDAKSLEKAIKKNLKQTPKDSQKRRESLKQHFDILDGKASERAAEFIEYLLQKKNFKDQNSL
jgi:UDP-N-acetylglucosamine 2-epimerase